MGSTGLGGVLEPSLQRPVSLLSSPIYACFVPSYACELALAAADQSHGLQASSLDSWRLSTPQIRLTKLAWAGDQLNVEAPNRRTKW
eukprot:COSAG02_NODE_1616_length_11659_cov_17.704239_4_plen_87_part_00